MPAFALVRYPHHHPPCKLASPSPASHHCTNHAQGTCFGAWLLGHSPVLFGGFGPMLVAIAVPACAIGCLVGMLVRKPSTPPLELGRAPTDSPTSPGRAAASAPEAHCKLERSTWGKSGRPGRVKVSHVKLFEEADGDA